MTPCVTPKELRRRHHCQCAGRLESGNTYPAEWCSEGQQVQVLQKPSWGLLLVLEESKGKRFHWIFVPLWRHAPPVAKQEVFQEEEEGQQEAR